MKPWPPRIARLRRWPRILDPDFVRRKHSDMIVIAEAYKGGKYDKVVRKLAELTNMAILSVDEHGELFSKAGYSDVRIIERFEKG